MAPEFQKYPVNGVELAVWDWPGDEPAIMLCHATGFHARIWGQIVARLGGRHVLALDMRGHGQSSKPEPPYRWRCFGEDVAALAEVLRIENALGCGHSMGGHSVTLAAALRPRTFLSLVLIDPVIRARERYTGPLAGEHFAARRRNRWTSWEEMYERFKPREPFSAWDDATLRDYCRFGLAPDGDRVVLACPPHVEASIYQNSPAHDADLDNEISRVDVPVLVMRAPGNLVAEQPQMASSPCDPALASRFRHGRDMFMPDNSHFIPMEAPDRVAAQILGAS